MYHMNQQPAPLPNGVRMAQMPPQTAFVSMQQQMPPMGFVPQTLLVSQMPTFTPQWHGRPVSGLMSGTMPGMMPGMTPQMPMHMPPRQHCAGFCSAGPASALPTSNDDDEVLDALRLSGNGAQPEAEPVASGEASLRVTARVEYRAMPRDGSRAVFGLVTLQASPAASTEERQPMDLVCVLDVSGSMDGHKIQQVQDSVRFIISQAQPQDRLAIVTFNSDAARPLGLRCMHEEGKDAAKTAVVQLQAGGGTSISAGLDLGLQVMEQRRQRNKVSAILLLTDGQDGSTRAVVPQLLQRAERECGCLRLWVRCGP
jgi:hypothetical protein